MNRSPLVETSVDCLAVRDARSRGEALSPEAAAHAERCPICSARVDALPAPGWDGDQVFSSLTAELDKERGLLGRLRAMKTSARGLAAAGAAFSVWAGIALFRPRSRLAPLPVTRVVVVVTVLSVLLALTVRLALRPLHAPPVSRRSLGLALFAGLAVPFLFAAVSRDVTAYASSAAGCFALGGALGAAFMGLLFAFDRGALSAKSTGFLAAAAGGLAANAALELHCPSSDPAHLVLGHATVGVALLALYAARGARAA